MRKWPAQVGTVVANVGRELILLETAIDMATADNRKWQKSVKNYITTIPIQCGVSGLVTQVHVNSNDNMT